MNIQEVILVMPAQNHATTSSHVAFQGKTRVSGLWYCVLNAKVFTYMLHVLQYYIGSSTATSLLFACGNCKKKSYIVGDAIDDGEIVAGLQLGDKAVKAKKKQSGIINFFKKTESRPKRSLSPSLPAATGKRTKHDSQPTQPPSKMPSICMTCFK